MPSHMPTMLETKRLATANVDKRAAYERSNGYMRRVALSACEASAVPADLLDDSMPATRRLARLRATVLLRRPPTFSSGRLWNPGLM